MAVIFIIMSLNLKIKNSLLKKLVREILNEDMNNNSPIGKEKVIHGNIKNILFQNRGIAMDQPELSTISSKLKPKNISALITPNKEQAKITISDDFSNKTTYIKKLINQEDKTTCVYASFSTVLSSSEEPTDKDTKPDENVIYQQSQPFNNNDITGKNKILADFVQSAINL